jgi:predicted outer membrane repeat protein
LAEVNVVDMNGLFNTVSNGVTDSANADNTGNSIMANGDTTILAVGSYKCSDGTCARSDIMLYTYGLYGEVKCVDDNASCVLDGENTRRGMWVDGTGSGTLILRALTFDKGRRSYGGGVFIRDGARVDLELLIFSNNRATDSWGGGGAIYVQHGGTIVNAYGTSFNGNTADSGDGDDIYRSSGTITITIRALLPTPPTLQSKVRRE